MLLAWLQLCTPSEQPSPSSGSTPTPRGYKGKTGPHVASRGLRLTVELPHESHIAMGWRHVFSGSFDQELISKGQEDLGVVSMQVTTQQTGPASTEELERTGPMSYALENGSTGCQTSWPSKDRMERSGHLSDSPWTAPCRAPTVPDRCIYLQLSPYHRGVSPSSQMRRVLSFATFAILGTRLASTTITVIQVSKLHYSTLLLLFVAGGTHVYKLATR
ncbi:hypothetical protein QBC37DRAFT_406244 [Rhypophila decipiens]|uniref:Uncharacterized protein n=1 Tax=Rhypophila decipiens TaxID=261697 RepID=A0AAN6XVL5_9PEZI|nr:hypothetical protein QBC37DRAFT_406244 [Rhypophila decipiens]